MRTPTVAILIVTYGNRASYLSQVIDACKDQGATHIVVVDNASEAGTKRFLQQSSATATNLSILELNTNTGSAGGYGAGLRFVHENFDVDYIWCLDDDNSPEPDALRMLIDAASNVSKSTPQHPILFSFRKTFDKDHSLAIERGIRKQANPHFWTILANRYRISKLRGHINHPIVPTEVGPYGGMFLPISAVKLVGFPNANFYLYGDDFEFQLRAAKQGFECFVVAASVVTDLDRAGSGEFRYFGKDANHQQLYYRTRNHLYLRRVYSQSQILFSLDVAMFLSYSFAIAFLNVLNAKRRANGEIRVMLTAVKDSFSDNFKAFDHPTS
jgi:GT2 family glycosyltransferase